MMKSRVSRVLVAFVCTACATSRPVEPERGYVRLLDVQPEVGTRLAPGTTIRVRAAYRLPGDASGQQASLMFLTEGGSLVSAAGARPVQLTEREGVIELSAEPVASHGALRRPLTAIVMIMGRPGADTIHGPPGDLPPEVRARLDRMRDSAAAGGRDGLRVRTVVRRVPMSTAVRSRAIFYNGAGPAPGLRGPALPFEEAFAEYRTYRGHKAFALAVDPQGLRTWGYGFGFAVADSAVARALRECERGVARRQRNSTCQIYAVGDSILPAR